MAEPVEDKGLLTQKLEKDRQKRAVQAAELKKDYNVLRKLRASFQKALWAWTTAALLVGFLLSRLPPRRQEVLLGNEPFHRVPSRKVPLSPTRADNDEFSEMKQLLSLTKWAVGAYIIRILERRLIEPIKRAAEWLRSGAECRVPNGHRRRSDQSQLREVGSTSTWSSQDPPETSERLLICRPLSRSSMLPVWAIRREQHPLCLHRYARDYTTNSECLCAQSDRCSEAAL